MISVLIHVPQAKKFTYSLKARIADFVCFAISIPSLIDTSFGSMVNDGDEFGGVMALPTRKLRPAYGVKFIDKARSLDSFVSNSRKPYPLRRLESEGNSQDFIRPNFSNRLKYRIFIIISNLYSTRVIIQHTYNLTSFSINRGFKDAT